jgi:hypothetical protein
MVVKNVAREKMRRTGIGSPSNQETALPCWLFCAKNGDFAILDQVLFEGDTPVDAYEPYAKGV